MKAVHRYRVPAEAARLIGGLHPQIKRKMRAALDLLAREPYAGKALHGELEGLRSLRVGGLRIVYRTASRGIIEIVAVGPRQAIYVETLRRVGKIRERG